MDLTINWFISQLRINQEWNRIIIHVCNWVEIGYLTPSCNGDTNFDGPIPHPIFSETANMETWHCQTHTPKLSTFPQLTTFCNQYNMNFSHCLPSQKTRKNCLFKSVLYWVEAKDKFEWRMKGYRNTNFAHGTQCAFLFQWCLHRHWGLC